MTRYRHVVAHVLPETSEAITALAHLWGVSKPEAAGRLLEYDVIRRRLRDPRVNETLARWRDAAERVRAAAAQARAERRATREPPVTARPVEGPVHGWREATVVWSGGRWLFGSIGMGNMEMTRWEQASCVHGHDHRSPEPSCTCGFYALKQRPPWIGAGCWLLRVELQGRIIVASNGYRAEYQKVLSAEPGPCECGSPAELIVMDGMLPAAPSAAPTYHGGDRWTQARCRLHAPVTVEAHEFAEVVGR